MSELISVTIENHIADVRLNRPEKMNALSRELFSAIESTGEALKRNRSVRVVVLSGEGASFCAGLDVEMFSSIDDIVQSFSQPSAEYPNYYQRPAWVWKQLPVPVICALKGIAFGGGFQIAMAADIRIAHSDTQLSLLEIKWGLLPDMSASQTLRDLVRIDVAKELAFTGRKVGSEEALELGLITAIDDSPHEKAMALARKITHQNPDAISYCKYLFDHSWQGEVEQGLLMEERLQAKLVGSHNQVEAIRSVMEKREAHYQDRNFDDFSTIELDSMDEIESNIVT